MNPNVFEQPFSNSIFKTYWSPRTSELMVKTGAQFIRFYVVHTSCHDKNVEMKIMHVSVLGPPILFTPFLSLPCSTDARSVASSTIETILTIYFLGHPCCCTWAWRLVVNCFIIGTASHRCSNLLILCTSPNFQATMSPPTFRNHPPPGGPAGGSQLDASEIASDENECKWVPMEANRN